MTNLIANLGAGKGSWKYLVELITKQDWNHVFLVTNSFGAERFAIEGRELTFIIIDDNKSEKQLVQDILAQLDKVKDTEVALNMVSGTGKEHMALLAALLKSGLGIRLVSLENNSVVEL